MEYKTLNCSLSTFRAYFEGKKELFEGLAMEKLEQDWVKYPILYLDLNVETYDTVVSLNNRLHQTLAEWEEMYEVKTGNLMSTALRFENIIKRVAQATGQKVVILVDEYDKPMLQTIGKPELQNEYRSILKTNYRLEDMTREELTVDTLNSIDIMDENPLPLLFQSGYLTIKDYNKEFGTYILGFPNREVEEGFTKFLMPNRLRQTPANCSK